METPTSYYVFRASNKRTILIEVLDTFEVGGVTLAAVRAVHGEPFVGGDKWPRWTRYSTIELALLEPVKMVRREIKVVEEVVA